MKCQYKLPRDFTNAISLVLTAAERILLSLTLQSKIREVLQFSQHHIASKWKISVTPQPCSFQTIYSFPQIFPKIFYIL